VNSLVLKLRERIINMRKIVRQLQKLKKLLKLLRSESIHLPISAIVPAGFLPIYVGKEDHRFIVDIHYLNHPLFAEVLDLSARELGYSHKGALRIACDIPLFESHILKPNRWASTRQYGMQTTGLLKVAS